jgi:hypothetical protein
MLVTHPATAQVTVYSNDFDGSAFVLSGVGASFSSFMTSPTPGPAGGNPAANPSTTFLGAFSAAANASTDLMLNNLPQHTAVSIAFDLYIIGTWDGNTPTVGPDIWDLRQVGSGTPLLRTTFSNMTVFGETQDYPDSYPGGNNPAFSGAAQQGTLGYYFGSFLGDLDAVYSLSFTMPDTSGNLALHFSNNNQDGGLDEQWGIDNLRVSITPAAVPEGGTLTLLTGLAIPGGGLLLRRRRKK